MRRYIESISKQIKHNQVKNIFLDQPEMLHFINDTLRAISTIHELNKDAENFLIDYATDKTLEEFCRVNQYYSFDSKSRHDLSNIYSGLFETLRSKKISTDEISKSHYQHLKDWLIRYNAFALKIYTNAEQVIEPVACSAYSAELQMNI